MTRRFVSGVASRGAFVNVNGEWMRSEDFASGTWGWSVRSDIGWSEPKQTLREAQDEAARMQSERRAA